MNRSAGTVVAPLSRVKVYYSDSGHLSISRSEAFADYFAANHRCLLPISRQGRRLEGVVRSLVPAGLKGEA